MLSGCATMTAIDATEPSALTATMVACRLFTPLGWSRLDTDDTIRALIHNRAAESQIFVAAEAAGLRPMREDGQRLIEQGVTSVEEVMSVTRD